MGGEWTGTKTRSSVLRPRFMPRSRFIPPLTPHRDWRYFALQSLGSGPTEDLQYATRRGATPDFRYPPTNGAKRSVSRLSLDNRRFFWSCRSDSRSAPTPVGSIAPDRIAALS